MEYCSWQANTVFVIADEIYKISFSPGKTTRRFIE